MKKTRTTRQNRDASIKKARSEYHDAGLKLDAIWDSPDPEVKTCLTQYMYEEYRRADERVLQRLAERFIHLLPPNQQQLVRQSAVA